MDTGLKSLRLVEQRLQQPADFELATSLPDGEVVTWQYQMRSGDLDKESLRATLSGEELHRAERFRHAADRDRYLLGRGVLRQLLGRYLNRAPASFVFQYTEFGKPYLADTSKRFIDFNVSHSGDILLWAFALRRKIGVDVERIRVDFSCLEIAERFFSVEERERLRGVAANDRPLAFFRCWTRKEAFIKALGEGLSHPLSQFDVAFGSYDEAKLLATRPKAADVERWTMWNLSVPFGYAGALVAER